MAVSQASASTSSPAQRMRLLPDNASSWDSAYTSRKPRGSKARIMYSTGFSIRRPRPPIQHSADAKRTVPPPVHSATEHPSHGGAGGTKQRHCLHAREGSGGG